MGHRTYQRALSLTPAVAVLAMAGAVVTPVLSQPAAHAQSESHSAQVVSTQDPAAQKSAMERDLALRSLAAAETSRAANRAALAARTNALETARATTVLAQVAKAVRLGARAREQDRLRRIRAAALLVQQREVNRLRHVQAALLLLRKREVQALAAQQERARTQAVTRTSNAVSSGSPQAYAQSLITNRIQYDCLVLLWNRESGWNYRASNPSSGAYGIPQSLPGTKMATAGADWRTNPNTQIRWGVGYIRDRYETPCGAWAHSQAVGWY
jgi:hypothetical protein